MAIVENKRGYAAAHFALELNGESNGMIKSIEGGGVKVDVMTYQQGGIYDRWRQLGKPKFEDFKISIGMSISQPYYKWIEAFFTGKQDRRDGAIVAGDFYYNERARREFTFGMISEITIPGVDVSSKEALYMNLSLAVESIKFAPGRANRKLDEGGVPAKTKLWKADQFHFNLGPYETTRVTKVDAMTIKQTILEYHHGGSRAPTKTPSQIQFPNVVFYMPEPDAQPLIERFMANGGAVKPPDAKPIPDGWIQYNGSDTSRQGRLNFHNSEIISITPDKSDATSENIKQVKIELTCESMDFEY
jgi:hypothetical protein